MYTTEWFLSNTLPEHRHEIHNKALFYTKGTSKQARQLACSSGDYVTIWDIWPKWLYENNLSSDNKLRCIHNDRAQRMIFFENMSRAYVRMARKSATIMHLRGDYSRPPLDGIWGRVELPAVQSMTDILQMSKINEDRSLSDVFVVPKKATRTVFEAAIAEVQAMFRRAKSGLYKLRATNEATGSCSIWDAETDGYFGSLF